MPPEWLQIKRHGADRFSGTCKEPVQADGRTFGGQMIAQCLHCAYETLSSEFIVNSFHCYFLRPGLSSQPMEYAVTRLRDGQNFSARRVEARQNAKLAFTIDFSFQKLSTARSFKSDVPPFPIGIRPPESLPSVHEIIRDYLKRGGDPNVARGWRAKDAVRHMYTASFLDFRSPDGDEFLSGPTRPGSMPIRELSGTAIRFLQVSNENQSVDSHPVELLLPQQRVDIDLSVGHMDPEDRKLAHYVLMYISDYFMGMSGALACAGQNLRLITSLDHAGWIHDYSFKPNEWLLYERECDHHSQNRSLTRGRLFSRRLFSCTPMANKRTGGQRTGGQRTQAAERRDSARAQETQTTSAMDVDANPAPDNTPSQLEHVLARLEARANAEIPEGQALESARDFQLIFQALCPLLRSHLSKQPAAQLDKFEAKSAVVDERRSRTLVLKNVAESNKPQPVARAHDDLGQVNKMLNFLDVSVVVESTYRLPSRVPDDTRPRLLCVVLPSSHFVNEIMQKKKSLPNHAQLKKISVNRSLTKEQQNIEYQKRQEKRKDLGVAAKSHANPSSVQNTASNGGSSSAQSNRTPSPSHSPPGHASIQTTPVAPPRKMPRRSTSQAPSKNC